MTATREPIDLGFALLDRQIVDQHDRPIAKVDDLEYAKRPDGSDYLTAILCGPGAWGPRLGGRIGTWVVAIWSRLHPDAEPSPVRIPIAYVGEIGSAIRLTGPLDGATAIDSARLARWVDAHLVSPIPGASHEP